jgi:predicted regulator of Ras-like GTPase activity (Roadblock/LC7/MglB family)
MTGQAKAVATGVQAFERVLQELLDQGGFQAAVLANGEGLPVATVAARQDADVTSAMVAMLQRVSEEARQRLGMADVDQVAIRDRAGARLVCRSLYLGEQAFLLAVMVPPRTYYRQATNRALRQIRQAWQRGQP